MKGEIKIQLDNTSPEELLSFDEIFRALIRSGGLSGVKGGKTILHFDAVGIFQGIELDYWPYRRRAK